LKTNRVTRGFRQVENVAEGSSPATLGGHLPTIRKQLKI